MLDRIKTYIVKYIEKKAQERYDIKWTKFNKQYTFLKEYDDMNNIEKILYNNLFHIFEYYNIIYNIKYLYSMLTCLIVENVVEIGEAESKPNYEEFIIIKTVEYLKNKKVIA